MILSRISPVKREVDGHRCALRDDHRRCIVQLAHAVVPLGSIEFVFGSRTDEVCRWIDRRKVVMTGAISSCPENRFLERDIKQLDDHVRQSRPGVVLNESCHAPRGAREHADPVFLR